MKGIRNTAIGFLAATILGACGQTPAAVSNQEVTQHPEAEQTYTSEEPIEEQTYTLEPTLTQTLESTPTYKLEPTATATPLEGRLFFDMNGSGIQDSDEPGLSGFTVCGTECVQTDSEGYFSLPNNSSTLNTRLQIKDPNRNTPSQMNFITQLKGVKIIPTWEWNDIIYPEQILNDIAIFHIEKDIYLQLGESEIGLMQTNLALCPVDLSLPGVYFFEGYIPGTHAGIDIAGPYGTPHRSPDKCKVDSLYVDGAGGQGILLKCENIDALKVGLGHGDFSFNNYETLAWFGIPVSTFFDRNGNPLLNTYNIHPTKNNSLYKGQDIHFYMASTGRSGLVHTHIGIWTLLSGQLTDWNNPILYLDCSD